MSPHAKARTSVTPANGSTRAHVPSPLFRRTTGDALRTPTTMSRSPSISMSAGHAPEASTARPAASAAARGVSSENTPPSPWMKRRTPTALAVTRSSLKSLFQSTAITVVAGPDVAPVGSGNGAPAPSARCNRRPSATNGHRRLLAVERHGQRCGPRLRRCGADLLAGELQPLVCWRRRRRRRRKADETRQWIGDELG